MKNEVYLFNSSFKSVAEKKLYVSSQSTLLYLLHNLKFSINFNSEQSDSAS